LYYKVEVDGNIFTGYQPMCISQIFMSLEAYLLKVRTDLG